MIQDGQDLFPDGPPLWTGRAYVLWDNRNGSAALGRWSGGNSVESKAGPGPLLLGPFTGWVAQALASGPEGAAFLLWTGRDQRASVWRVEPDGGTHHVEFGPYPGWEAAALATGPDGLVRLLWRGPEGTAALWRLNPALDLQEAPGVRDFGPYPGWTAAALSVGPNNRVHLLWTHADGDASLWRLKDDGPDEGVFPEPSPTDAQMQFGPYPGWRAASVAAGRDGTSRLLWRGSGLASVWTVPADGSAQPAPDTRSQPVHGPCENWTALAAASGPDGGTHLLWGHDGGGLASVWWLGPDGAAMAHAEQGPHGGWNPVALAMG